MLVYKITFPDGHFYIGRTFNLKGRMTQHYANKESKLSVHILKHCACAKDLLALTEVLYEGNNYKIVEIVEISKNVNDEFSLNGRFDELNIINITCIDNDFKKSELAERLGISYQDLSRVSRFDPKYLKKCEDEYNALVVSIHALKLRKPSGIAIKAIKGLRCK